jgi:hypothetical protein
VLVFGSSILAANGISVTTCWRYGCQNWTPAVPETNIPDACSMNMEVGALVKFTIAANQVTAVDTIVKMTTALCQYPAIRLDGKKIAFFRWGYQVQGTTLKNLNTGSFISVVDASGQNMTNIVAVPGTLGYDNALDWPADGWIYYSRPRTDATNADDRSGYEIWKVNPNAANPASTNQKVMSISSCQYIRRFSLMLDGTRAGMHSYPLTSGGCGSSNHGITFPGGADLGGTGACNCKISASGRYVGGFMGGAHDWVVLGYWTGSRYQDFNDYNNFAIPRTSIYQATKWAGFDMGSDAGVEQLCFSSNSDKWYTENVAWHYGGFRRGTNQLIVNWMDKQAIIPTKNPDCPTVTNGEPTSGTWSLQAFAGDFWVQPPAGTDWAYEDTAGAWHQMTKPSDLTDAAARQDVASGIHAFAARIDAAGILRITLPDGVRAYTVSVIDASGRTIVSRQVRGSAQIAMTGLRMQGACIIRAAAGPESLNSRIILAR